jgi:hypothetical protein
MLIEHPRQRPAAQSEQPGSKSAKPKRNVETSSEQQNRPSEKRRAAAAALDYARERSGIGRRESLKRGEREPE